MFATAVLFSATPALATPSPTPTPDPWAHVRFMAGEWRGESEGRPGKGTVERNYAFVLNNRFLHETNVSTYPPQEKNPMGEIHHHWSFFSYDRARKAIVLRQFHQEGFVNQFVLRSPQGPLVFESEALENVPPAWKARETYEVVSPDEFIETFELANAGTFEVYSRTRFRRVAGRGGPADEFLRLETAWNGAHLRGDVGVLEALWDEALVVTVPRMAPMSRDSAIAFARSGRMTFERYESSDVGARVFGDSAVVEGRLRRARRTEDRLVEDDWSFVKVYVRRTGGWRVVAFTATDAPL